MLFAFTRRMLREVSWRLLWKSVRIMAFKGLLAVQRYKRRLRQGKAFPAFVFISVTNHCNLQCQGCWVTSGEGSPVMSAQTLHNVIESCKSQGSYFFGLLGGEPLMYPHLMEVISGHPECYFQVFTNGTLLTDEVAASMRNLGNVTPLISVEGLGEVSDERRGGDDVYARTMAGLEACRRHKLITGVATSVCQSNFDDLVSDDFVQQCVSKGVHYLWYYIYRPVGPRPTPELALSEEQILKLRRFIVEARLHAPIMIIDTYWDKDGNAVCPGAIGLSHHINAAGDLEFCPPMQFACENIGDGTDLADKIESSRFLAELRSRLSAHSRGCILLENPALLKTMVSELGAYDSSGRGCGADELAAMCPCAGHDLPGKEIPDKSWVYRFAKKYWFFGFGAYG